MADSTYSPQATDPAIQGLGSELYDEIMAAIDPELVSANIPLLKEKYADETPEQSDARAARYDWAYEEFDRRLADREMGWADEMRRMKREAIASTEREDRIMEKPDIDALDQKIAQS
jgi:hypothetical protein